MKRLVPLALLMLLAAAADADDDHDRARAALARGEILPLSRIMALVAAEHRGRLLEVELEDEDGRPSYDIALITESGRIIELSVDAATGEIFADDDRDSQPYRRREED